MSMQSICRLRGYKYWYDIYNHAVLYYIFIVRKIDAPVGIILFSHLCYVKLIVEILQILGVLHLLKNVS